jgi:hypothetical protein
MKRSKLFLGATAGLLAIAAFASAKARWTNIKLCYFNLQNAIVTLTRAATISVNGNQLRTHSFLLYTYHTVESVAVCETPVYPE